MWRLACSVSVHVFHLSLGLFPYFSVPDDTHLVMSDVSLLSFNFSLLNTIAGNRDAIFHLTSHSSVLSVQPHMRHLFYVTRGKMLIPYKQAICLSRLYTSDLHEIFIVSLYKVTQKKRELLKPPTKIEEIQERKLLTEI